MKKPLMFILSLVMLASIYSCKKFLSERHTSSITNISSLRDMQMLMDAGQRVNFNNYSCLLEQATDNFFVGKGGFERANDFDKSVYLWTDDYIHSSLQAEASHWGNVYHVIAIANSVLDELPHVVETNGLSKETIEGTALFHRAFSYVNLVQIYCKAYDPATSVSDLGLPMRLSSDVNIPSVRETLEETYGIIERDIEQAIRLLPETSEYQTRPNKKSAYALMAKFYVLMERYDDALRHADACLSRYSGLMDFNKLDGSKPYPIASMNEETLFFGYGSVSGINVPSLESYIDTMLYKSYDMNDLRKTLFFKSENNGYHSFRGSYMGAATGVNFLGLTVSEVLLIKSEALARLGRSSESLAALNQLLAHRYRKDGFKPISGLAGDDLLEFVLNERRKELIYRGTRWSDLKRLNRDPRFAKTLLRKVAGYSETYELPPNDPRYVFMIPKRIVERTGMQQNPR